ncbi:MAG: hypothetical protein AB1847_01200 [bacterium]
MTVFPIQIKKKIKGQVKKVKVWRYDFQLKGKRYQSPDFKTKTEAKEAEDKKRAELTTPQITEKTSLTFFELVNRRLAYFAGLVRRKTLPANSIYGPQMGSTMA